MYCGNMGNGAERQRWIHKTVERPRKPSNRALPLPPMPFYLGYYRYAYVDKDFKNIMLNSSSITLLPIKEI